MTVESTERQQALLTASSPVEEFQSLERDEQAEVFFQLPDRVQETIVDEMDEELLYRFVRRLDPDEAADVLNLASEGTRTSVLDRLDADRQERVAFLLQFSPESAAGLMQLDYVTVDVEQTVTDIARRVERYENTTGRFPTIFVTEDGALLGKLPGQILAIEEDGVNLREHLVEVPTVRFDSDEESVLEVFRENPDRSVAVLDEDDEILGVIHSEDLLRLIDRDAGETLYEFTGVQEGEHVLDGPLSKVRHRYKWLIINLGTAFLAAGAVGFFEDTIAAFTLLAVYMPVVAGMGGNAGTQSMAVTVRGLAYGHISLATGTRAIVNEILAGAANGFITGVLVALIASVFNRSPLLGLVLGVSMVLNLVIAGFFGTLIPLVLDRIGKDPATSATIFITTATDVLGFFIFLGLAQSVL